MIARAGEAFDDDEETVCMETPDDRDTTAEPEACDSGSEWEEEEPDNEGNDEGPERGRKS